MRTELMPKVSTTESIETPLRIESIETRPQVRKRRVHSPELKRQVVVQCAQSGASIAAVALEQTSTPACVALGVPEIRKLLWHPALQVSQNLMGVIA